MEKKVFMERLFSKRREKLVEKCISLHRMGKSFIYILPSSAALQDVRKRFFKYNKGILGSKVIVFDDLEMEIVKDSIHPDNIIYSPSDRMIISEICKENKDKLRYYAPIYDKRGLHDEISGFIRALKRGLIDNSKLTEIMNTISDDVLKDKLQDMLLLYESYNNVLDLYGIYDRNDISIKAVELAQNYRDFEETDSIIIDGFTDIEIVSMKLIEKLAEADRYNIYVNCPYRNAFMEEFLYNQIQKPFYEMGFEIINSAGELYQMKNGIKELCEKLYSGERMNGQLNEVSINRYPSIEAEIRGTGRDIKKKIMGGEEPENIGVYINNRDAYSRQLANIFREYKIPLSLTYEAPLGASEMMRHITGDIENRDEYILPMHSWLEILFNIIEEKKPYIASLMDKAVNNEADFEDIFEIKAFDVLSSIAGKLRLGFEKSGVINEDIGKGVFLEIIYDLLKERKIAVRQGNNRGVKVLDTALAKGVYYGHIYILGLNEGEVPGTAKGPGLFDMFENTALSERGIRYKDYYWELNREKIRFNLALSSSMESISLSYRSSDEDGKYAIASSFIDEVKFISGLEENIDMTMRDRFETSFNDVCSPQELSSNLIKNAFEGKYMGRDNEIDGKDMDFTLGYNNKLESLFNIGRIEYHREREEKFNMYEGIMGDGFKDTALYLCSFSPSALSTYVSCPFKYMMDYLFEAGEEDEEEGAYSAIEVGNLYHEVLYRYYNDVNQYDVFEGDTFNKAFDIAFGSLRSINVDQGEMTMLKEGFADSLKRFINADLSRMKAFQKISGNIIRPYMLEKFMENRSVFGVNIKCVIDRVDIEYKYMNGKLSPTGRYIIYDYKKKSIAGINEVLENKNYQLPIYYHLLHNEMLKEFGDSAECMGLLYLSIEKSDDSVEKDGIYKTEYKKALDFGRQRSDVNGDKFGQLMDYVKGMIMDTISHIKSGNFNYKPMCGNFEGYSPYGCRYESICRYSKSKARVVLRK